MNYGYCWYLSTVSTHDDVFIATFLPMPCTSPMLTASKQLSKVAVQLVKESFGELLYEKAMGCVKALREKAVEVS